jgi:hypothetical protein
VLSWRLRGSSRRAGAALKAAATQSVPTGSPPEGSVGPDLGRSQVLDGRRSSAP